MKVLYDTSWNLGCSKGCAIEFLGKRYGSDMPSELHKRFKYSDKVKLKIEALRVIASHFNWFLGRKCSQIKSTKIGYRKYVRTSSKYVLDRKNNIRSERFFNKQKRMVKHPFGKIDVNKLSYSQYTTRR